MVRGWYPRSATYPEQPVPYEAGKAVSSDSDSHFTSIQDAIDATDAGGVVVVGGGTFNESVTISKDNFTLIGSGRPTLINGGTTGHAVSVTGASVTVKDLSVKTTAGQGNSFDGINQSGVDNDECEFKNIYVEESDRHGIFLQNGDDHVISDVIVAANIDNDGVVADGPCADVNISDGKVFGVGSDCYNLQGNRPVLHGCWGGGPGVAVFRIGGNNGRFIGCSGVSAGTYTFIVEAGATATHIRDPNSITPSTGTIDDSGTRTVLNGRYVNPPTLDLGGVDGELSPTDDTLDHYYLLVDAGGSASAVQGIDTIAQTGVRVSLVHAGGEAVTFEHNNGTATNPLLNKTGADFSLDTNGDFVEYLYTGSNWVEVSDSSVDVVASGSASLTSGAATIDTGVSESETATFYVALGPATDDAEITASIQANAAGNYEVHLDEINTSVGNPSVNYDIIRFR